MSEEVSEECNYITALHQIHHITSNENSLMVNTDHSSQCQKSTSPPSHLTTPVLRRWTFASSGSVLPETRGKIEQRMLSSTIITSTTSTSKSTPTGIE